jgi:hypothetical protein
VRVKVELLCVTRGEIHFVFIYNRIKKGEMRIQVKKMMIGNDRIKKGQRQGENVTLQL